VILSFDPPGQTMQLLQSLFLRVKDGPRADEGRAETDAGPAGVADAAGLRLDRRLAYRNDTQKYVFLIVEPWSEEYMIRSGESVEILIYVDASTPLADSAAQPIDMAHVPDGLVIHGFPGSVIYVAQDGAILEPIQN